MLARPRFADAVVVSTRDDRHHEPTIAALQAGYHVLVEKPMATTEAEALDMVRTAERTGRILAVCHVLRYTAYTKVLRELIDAGGGRRHRQRRAPRTGRLVAPRPFLRPRELAAGRRVDLHADGQVGARHRLARTHCRPAGARVSSFGSLSHFRPEHRPAGAADRCLDCGVEPSCPYSAPRLYLSCLQPDRAQPMAAVGGDLLAHPGGRAVSVARGPVRPLRLRLRQRRRRPPGGQHRVSGRRDRILHHGRVHPPHVPQDKDLRLARSLEGDGTVDHG